MKLKNHQPSPPSPTNTLFFPSTKGPAINGEGLCSSTKCPAINGEALCSSTKCPAISGGALCSSTKGSVINGGAPRLSCRSGFRLYFSRKKMKIGEILIQNIYSEVYF